MNRALATCDERPGPQASHVPASDASLTVELRSDINLRAEDVASLDSLIDGRPSVGVFLSKAWLSGLFDEPPAGFEPALVLLREAGALRGIVPIGVRHTLTHARVILLGGGLGSDRIDVLAARGFEACAADTFLGWLRETFGRRAFVLELGDVPTDSSLWGAIHRAGIERKLRLALQPREVHTLPYLDLADSWPPAAAGAPRSPNSRSIDKHRRWLERRGRSRVEMLEDPADVMKAFDLLRRFLHDRWRDQPGGSVLDNPRTLRFHQRALPLLLKEGRLRMIRLWVETRPIAVFYGVATNRWWGYYLAGYDRQWAGRIHLGQITLAAAIDAASREAAREFDFLKGADRVKYLWPVRERATLDADVYSEKSGAQFKRATRAGRDAAVAFAKSAREFLSNQLHGSHSRLR